ncbi:MAG: DUF4316 domain-containing protein [Pseudobutyrivibrio sp.]|nr:DUF4316 domain-containing protein [Pseudobutyrivibrio sp.]
MEEVLERKDIQADSFGYNKEFVTAKEWAKRGAEAAPKVPEPVIPNPIKTVEDMVEQNDNSHDGIINNLPPVKDDGNPVSLPGDNREEKKSVLEELLRARQENSPIPPKAKCRVCEAEERSL